MKRKMRKGKVDGVTISLILLIVFLIILSVVGLTRTTIESGSGDSGTWAIITYQRSFLVVDDVGGDGVVEISISLAAKAEDPKMKANKLNELFEKSREIIEQEDGKKIHQVEIIKEGTTKGVTTRKYRVGWNSI